MMTTGTTAELMTFERSEGGMKTAPDRTSSVPSQCRQHAAAYDWGPSDLAIITTIAPPGHRHFQLKTNNATDSRGRVTFRSTGALPIGTVCAAPIVASAPACCSFAYCSGVGLAGAPIFSHPVTASL